MMGFVFKTAAVVCVGLAAWFLRRWLRRRRYMCECRKNLTGMVAIVTGASSGIGAAVAEELARRGCLVLMACRDMSKAQRVKACLPHAVKMSVLPLDLASPHSIETFLAQLMRMPELLPIQLLVNNAAVFDPPERFTASGLEMHFAVNHLGHFHLTSRLIELGFLAKGARVVSVASALAAHAKLDSFAAYTERFSDQLVAQSARRLYANSKLANCLFARELHRRYHDNYTSLCVQTDGMAATGLFRHPLNRAPPLLQPLLRVVARLLLRSPFEAAQNAIHCCVASDHFLRPGALYSKCRPTPWFDAAVQNRAAENLWEVSEQLVIQRMPTLSVTFESSEND